MSSLALQLHDNLEPLLPPSYTATKPHIETASVSDVESRTGGKLREFLSNVIPIWFFRADDRALRARKAIAVRIRNGGIYFFAGNETLAIEGTGLSAAEAIDDFGFHVTHFYSYYQTLTDEQVSRSVNQQAAVNPWINQIGMKNPSDSIYLLFV